MATQQHHSGVPFSIAHDLQQFRLLELPPDLLELIDSATPPPLSIKSQAVSSASSTANTTPAYAVLCTPTKTFQLRQVQTSNSVFIAHAGLHANTDTISQPGVSAIASCSATLELHPSSASAIVLLKPMLPLYDMIDGSADVSGNGKGKADIFADIPLSNGDCQAAWDALIAFEFAGSSFHPSANTLSQAWFALHSAALAEGIKLDNQFLTQDLLKAVDDEPYPSSLMSAILHRLATAETEAQGSWCCLDPRETVRFVGQTILEAKLDGHYLTAEFLDLWKNSVPEAWRNDAELDTIKGQCHFPSSTTIAFGPDAATGGPASQQPEPKAASSSRKWHERFGRARQR